MALLAPRRAGAWSLALYALLSFAFFGIPVVGHFGSSIIGANELDPSNYMWFLGWWPHALAHGLNPLYTHLVFVPEGYNLAWVASVALPSLVLAPITAAFGPLVTWNVLQLLAPALSAWTAFLLCRHITRSLVPSLVGGYLFGFSPYMLGHLVGAPQLALVALLPVFVLLVLRHVEGSLSGRAFVGATAVALAAELLISTEVAATSVLFGAIALAVAFGLFPERRAALRRTLELIVGAGLAAALLVSPLLFYVLFRPYAAPEQALRPFPADLLSFVVPNRFIGLHVPGAAPGYASGFAYLGLPLLALVGIFAWRQRHSRAAQLMTILVGVGFVASLGGRLVIAGHNTHVPLPWALFAELPGLRYAIPLRFSVFMFLPVAVIVARWLSERPSAGRWALALLAVLFIAPRVGNVGWNTKHVTDPAFFASGQYRAYIKRSDRLLTIPNWGPNTRWQANAGFRFSLAGGYLGAFPRSYTRYPTWLTLQTGRLSPDYRAQLRRYVRDKGVTAIVVDKRYLGPWRRLFGTLGVRPLDTGGVLFYRLPEQG